MTIKQYHITADWGCDISAAFLLPEKYNSLEPSGMGVAIVRSGVPLPI